MTETLRPKMHIWGPDRAQRVIFVDEKDAWYERGWRDHPNKVGQPLDEVKPEPKIEPVEEAAEPVKAATDTPATPKKSTKKG